MEIEGKTTISNNHSHNFKVEVEDYIVAGKTDGGDGEHKHIHEIKGEIGKDDKRALIKTSEVNGHTHSVALVIQASVIIKAEESKDVKAALNKAGVPFEEV